MKLSVSMKHKLLLMARHYKTKYKRDLNILNNFLHEKVNTKAERKIVFDKIRELLA